MGSLDHYRPLERKRRDFLGKEYTAYFLYDAIECFGSTAECRDRVDQHLWIEPDTVNKDGRKDCLWANKNGGP